MIKWHFECTNCGATTNEKTSGSWNNGWPKNIDEANKICPIQDKKCSYCEHKMVIINYMDSTMGYMMCNGPIRNLETVIKK